MLIASRAKQVQTNEAVQRFSFTAYCLEVIELPYGQFEFKLICMASPL